MPGSPPTGFKRSPVDVGKRRDGSPHIVHRWVPDPELWDRCRQAWLMRARHATYLQIHTATHLFNSLNSYPTFFDNPLYKGELHYADLVISHYCEALVDQTTWETVQAFSSAHKKRILKHPRRVNSHYLLSGLAHCARCGSPMNGHTIQFKAKAETYDYYRCSRAVRRRDCDAEQIPRQFLEDQVLGSLANEVLDPTRTIEHRDQIERDRDQEAGLRTNERIEINKRLAHIRRRLANVVETLAETGSSPTLTAKLKSLEAEQAEFQAALDDLAAVHSEPLQDEQIISQAKKLRELIGGKFENDLRVILNGLVARIAVEREGRALRGLLTYYHPPDVADQEGNFMSMEKCPHGVTGYRHKYTISFVGSL